MLICLALGAFFYRFRKVAGILLNAKADQDFRLGSIPSRLKTFVWEVLLQGKVIAQRPLAGITHAFVFWGFCAFGLITINHFAAGFGAPLLSREGVFGRFYFGFAALFAVMVAVSIAWLAIRRFIIRPIWLGKVSAESGVIAALIFILMA